MPHQNRRRRYRTRLRPHRTLRTSPRSSPRTRQASQQPRPHHRRRPPRVAQGRRRSLPSRSRTRLYRRRRFPRRTQGLTRPLSRGEVGGAMGPCTSCVRRAVVRRGMVASSVERGSRRRVSSCRAVVREVSCRGPLPRLPLPLSASPRPKSGCQRRHKAFRFVPFQAQQMVLLASFFVCVCYCVELSALRESRRNLPPSPTPLVRSFYFSSSSFVGKASV